MTSVNHFSSLPCSPLHDAVPYLTNTSSDQKQIDSHVDPASSNSQDGGGDLSLGLSQYFDRLANARSEKQLYKIAAASIASLVSADCASFQRTQLQEGSVEVASVAGLGGIMKNSSFPLSQSACEFVLIRDRCFVFNDLSASVHPEHQILAAHGLKHAIATPVRHLGNTEGVLTAAWKGDWGDKVVVQQQMSIFSQFLGASLERVRSKNTARKVLDLLKHEANHDPLTSLPNRKWFRKALADEIKKCEKSDSHFAVLFVDLDDFKRVNDSLSHLVGDELLMLVADRMQRELRAGDAVARIGGDEFIVLFRNAPKVEDVKATAERILQRIQQPFIISDKEVCIGGSLGVSYYPDHGRTADELLSNSDLAMYTAKQHGKNQVHVFSKDLAIKAKEDNKLRQELERAIQDSELHFAFQPQRKIDSNEATSFEALIRWEHPMLGAVKPSRFLPISEQLGFVTRITAMALQHACAAIADLRKLIPDAYVCVNISPLDFVNLPLLTRRVDEALANNQLPGSALELELTEGIFFDHREADLQAIETWHANGIKIAIDDFGKGFSSLKYLMDLQVDTLKIDKSFVSKIHENVKATAHRQDDFGNG